MPGRKLGIHYTTFIQARHMIGAHVNTLCLDAWPLYLDSCSFFYWRAQFLRTRVGYFRHQFYML